MADNPQSGGLPAKAAALLGLPENLKFYSPSPFGGMNQQDASTAIDDKEFAYLENFVRLGNGQMRTLWDVGASVYTAPGGKTIVYYKFFTLVSTDYCAIFLSDGSAIQLNMSTLAQTTIGVSGFYSVSTGFLPYARQWGSTYLLISNRNTTNDYWVWDGTLLYAAGSAAPNGVNLASVGFNYDSTPTVTAVGGHGSGMTFDVEVSAGALSQILITNPGSGYQPGDVVQLLFSGGGSDTSAQLQAVLADGGVSSVSVSAGGSGYTSAPTVGFSGGGGTGATATATIITGVTSVAVTAGGTGYTSVPTVAFSGGGGTGATATAVINAGTGVVTAVNVTAVGSGYTSAPTVGFSGGGGTGATAAASVSGVVSAVTVTAPGSGYTTAPGVTFSGGGGSGAGAVANLTAQGLSSVSIVNAGSGFGGAIGAPVPTLTFAGGGGGSGATAQVVLAASAISNVVVTNPGAGYTSAPTVTVTGTSGSGATFVVNLANGLVQSIAVTNGGTGYLSPVALTLSAPPTGGVQATASVQLYPKPITSVIVTSPGQFYTSAPDVIISAGENNAAYATVSLMPFGVSGSAIETYLSRVWLVAPAAAPLETIPAGDQWSFSAAESVSDFATSDGGGSQVNTDSFLQKTYTGVRQSSGYLYLLGDGSASIVSNVGTTGTPATTTFNYQNVDPQAGLAWRDCLQDFGRSLVVANQLGVFGLYGGAMTKVSAKLDQLLSATPEGPAVYPQNGGVTPSSAVATIFNTKHYLELLTLKDPETGAARNVMLAWNEKDWFIASQSISFTFIAEQKVGSEYAAWGTDGSKLYPMFQTPSATLQKRMWTKAYGADSFFVQKTAQYLWLQGQDMSASGAGIAANITAEISTLGAIPGYESPPLVSGEYSAPLDQPNFTTPAGTWPIWGTSLQGIAFTTMGLKITSTSPDFRLGNLAIGYLNAKAYSG